MRIISGKARGTKIDTVDSISTRPTLDRVRESLFNIMQNEIKNKVILDLFAGSGALGIEALSRGAKHCVFCDIDFKVVNIINRNLEKTKLKQCSTVVNADYKKCINRLKKEHQKVDIVFIDPPYKADLAVKATYELIANSVMNEHGIIVIETDEVKRDKAELANYKGIQITDERKYGRANLLFLSLNEEN